MKITECLIFILMVVSILMLLIPASLRRVRGGNDDPYIYGRTQGEGKLIPLPFGVDDTVGDLIKEYKKWFHGNMTHRLSGRVEIHYQGKLLDPHTLISEAGIGSEAMVEIIVLPPQWSSNSDGLRVVIEALHQDWWRHNDRIMDLLLRHDLNPSTYDDGKLYNIEDWDVSNVDDMSSMFSGATGFNRDISMWNTSSVTDMSGMFANAEEFSGDISMWNTSSVTDMSGMFYDAWNFNAVIGGWNTSNVTNMSNMFDGADAFNRPLNWNTSKVTNMSSMFFRARSFNADISRWDTSNVTNMEGMFEGAEAFNQPLNWNTSKVTDMRGMFYRAGEFNADISRWITPKVTSMRAMFRGGIRRE